MMTYRQLNTVIHTLSEDELWSLLQDEREGERRFSMLRRIHQRYSSLRAQRERQALLREARVR